VRQAKDLFNRAGGQRRFPSTAFRDRPDTRDTFLHEAATPPPDVSESACTRQAISSLATPSPAHRNARA
jgi:hypothetical protein